MADSNAAFVGGIPQNYDRCLGPLLFHEYADDLVARVPVSDGMRILEIACGTGIATERLVRRLAGAGSVTATDLNEAMIAEARARIADESGISWQTADGSALPFDSESFDVVVCQFGLMFFPDKAAGVREAFRVLVAGGRYLLNVWSGMDGTPVVRITHETAGSFFPDDPPLFYTVPYGMSDPQAVLGLLADAGFVEIEWSPVEKTGESPSADEAAHGLIEGNPIGGAIRDRRPQALPEIERTLAANLRAELGDHPLRTPLRANVFSARRPT